MIAATVYNQLVDTLRESPILDYFNYVAKGVRFNIEPDSMPCIMCEVRANNEIQRDFGQIKKIWLDVDVMAFIASPADPDFAIAGDKRKGYYGVLDVENDIRAVLQSSNTLGCNAEDLQIQPTIFQDFDMKTILTRGVIIPIRILYRQVDGY